MPGKTELKNRAAHRVFKSETRTYLFGFFFKGDADTVKFGDAGADPNIVAPVAILGIQDSAGGDKYINFNFTN